MIDFFAIGLTHALLALAAWRLLLRDSLDHDPASKPTPAPKPVAETGDA